MAGSASDASGHGKRGAFHSIRSDPSRTLLISVALLAGTGFVASPAAAEKRVALAIGNDLYPNLPADRQLRKAANDATTIAGTLKSLGFEVIVGTNLGRQAMIDKLAEFTARLQPGDTAALFFAGHGVAIGGVNYLIPSDVPAVTEGAEARVRGASLAEPDLIAELQARSVRVALLVIDACRDNPFPRAAGRSIGNTRGLADARPARGIFTLYSAGIGQTALDRLGGSDTADNSVFTRIFAEQLKRPELHLGDLAVEVRERVAELALKATDERGQPAPHEQTPAYYDQTLGGRIYLAGLSTASRLPELAAMSVPTPTIPPVAERAAVRPQRPSAPGESCARNGLRDLLRQFGVEAAVRQFLWPGKSCSTGRPDSAGWRGNKVTAWENGSRSNSRGCAPCVRSVVRNGYQKSSDIFGKNNRVRHLRAVFSRGETQTFTLQDQADRSS